MQVINKRKNEAGFSLIELLVSTVLLIVGMLFFAALFASGAVSYINAERTRIGKTYADSGMGDYAARARRRQNVTPHTEAATWTPPYDGYTTSADGSVTRTLPSSSTAVYGLTQQKIVAGPAYIDFSPSWGSQICVYDANDYADNRCLVVGWGSWMAIYETDPNPAAQTCCQADIVPVFIQGNRYRIEFSDTTRYYLMNGSAKQLIYTSKKPPLRYPLHPVFVIYRDQNNSITNISMNGIFSDPNFLPDGGSITPGAACAAPYCDNVWQAPRNGAAQPAPVALPPDQAGPTGGTLLFVRRFLVRTVDSTTGVREITMTLATTTSEQPFLTRTTRVLANK